MADQRLVSVIIPSRDRPELVSRAVRSALAQTHQSLEIVVVDDCSSRPLTLQDGLEGDSRVRTLRLEEAGGAGEARNAGVRAARGELIAFLDDDDTWRPTKISRQLAALAAHAGVDAVETGYDLWDAGRLVLRYVPRPDRDYRTALLAKPYMQPSTVLMRRAAFEELGGFDGALARVEDWDFWVRFFDSHRATALPEVLVDRQASGTDPAELLRWYREIVRRLEPRIEALHPAARSSTRRTHLVVEAELLAELGDGRTARRRALEAWRHEPGNWRRPALTIVRSAIGERAWAGAKVAVRAVAHPLVRALGHDPLVRR